jgi:hypothetical protein
MAYKVILKHSSVLGKRPTNENIQPGEIALNTNASDPGAFFEATNGRVIKIGPTAVSATSPTETPGLGETWLNLQNGTFNIGTLEDAEQVWRSIAAPFLGGGGSCVFVAPEFSFSTDSIENNGQSLPYKTFTRAIIELSKIYLGNVLAGFSEQEESNRYTVFLSPSLATIDNGIGTTLEEFNVDLSTNPSREMTVPELTQFNPPSGGVIVPSGISVQGMDLKKSTISPTYVPTYRNQVFPTGLQGVDQPISSVLKCSGNVYLTNFSVVDKISYSEVVEVTQQNTYALFRTKRPHGLNFNDLVNIEFNPRVDQSTGTFKSGGYYTLPITPFTFYISTGSQLLPNSASYVLYSSIPSLAGITGPKLTVTHTLKSAHRLRLANNASFSEISDYYTKIQRAFPGFFGGRVTDGATLVNTGDFVIVGPTSQVYPNNKGANTVKNSSLYANQVNLRSAYGMCWGDFDGSIVDGFKSVTVNACTAVSLQNDPCVYEIYTTLVNQDGVSEQKWWNLTEAQYLSIPTANRPELITNVSTSDQLDLLNSTPINNIRYHYQNLVEATTNKNIGIVNTENDFRHFGFRVRNGAYAQLQSIYTIGPAIGVWALNGGVCNLTNSTSNFGSISFKSEGFLGINTIGGAGANATGFVLEGVQRPLSLSKSQAESIENKKILSLGAKIKNIYIDPADPFVQIIELNADFSPSYLLPYSLKPGTALWVDTEECTYRGFFVVDGGPTVITGLDDPLNFAKLRLRASDSTIPNDSTLLPVLGIPYIRRFSDPRQEFERAYSLYLKNTSPTAIAPQVGYVLRLNQTSQQLGANSLRPNVQFDPGILGGWGRVFTVDAVETGGLGSSPQFNYVVADTNQSLNYYVAITATDVSGPWYQGGEAKRSSGTYVTHKNRNWYAAENNMWDYVYFGQDNSFSSDYGPYSIAPFQSYSPYVDTSSLERQDMVSDAFQGSYAPDPSLDKYSNGSTYLRGATIPYPAYSPADYYDGDDSSESLGLCLTDVADGTSTYTVTKTEIIQTEQQASLATSTASAKRYRPAIIEFSVLSSIDIPNPKQKVSVVQLSSGSYSEYIRVISLNGTVIRGIRLTFENSFYSSVLPPDKGTNYEWDTLTKVTVCSINPTPESEVYDPAWLSTKAAILRFFEVMGYPNSVVYQFLEPKFWGERLLQMSSLNDILPSNGYAIVTDKWPLEFNQPSTIIANTHTWAYTGYINYSRGLLKYQTTDITKKLSADFQAYTLWSGRVTVTGINDKGEIIQFGPQRQALTANYYEATAPTLNLTNKQIYEEQPYVEFPSQVVVYSVDDISGGFNGSNITFNLTRAGLAIPPTQLKAESMFVILGAVVQKPNVDYRIDGNQITFLGQGSAPLAGTLCNIRVFTSVDSEKTLISVPFDLEEEFDGTNTIFTAYSPSIDITNLDINSNNTFIILGGVEQIPLAQCYGTGQVPWAYSLEKNSNGKLTITFNGAPPVNTTIDIRSVCTASYWASRSVYPVAVYSLDSISGLFDGARVIFDLTYQGKTVSATSVTEENLIVSLGGAVQVPGVGKSYTVENSQIIFSDAVDAPKPGTTINLRVITNAEFINCPIQGKYAGNFLEWGPGLVISLADNANEMAKDVSDLTVSVDALAQEVEALIATIGVTNVVSSGGSTGSSSLTITGTLSALIAPSDTVRIYDGNSYLGNATVNGITWTFTDNRAFSNNQVVVYAARVSDSAGNMSVAPNSYEVTIDTTAPNISATVVTVAQHPSS